MSDSRLSLKTNPTLADLQRYVEEMVLERGFDRENVSQKFYLLLEECGELAKAARKQSGMKTDATSPEYNVGAEAADVLIYLLDICNLFKIDLEQAFRLKEERNKQREWKAIE